jgi:hypothetical protein
VNKIGLNVEHDNLPMETLIIESLSTVENIRIKNLQVEERSFNNNFIQYLQTPVFNDLVNLRLEDITLADADVLDLLVPFSF